MTINNYSQPLKKALRVGDVVHLIEAIGIDIYYYGE
jgi:hypothetical protein